MLRLEGTTLRAFIVTSFFGNLTYLGLPIISHSLGIFEVMERPEILASTIVVLILMNVAYNIAAVATFSLARELDCDPEFVAATLTLSTLLSAVSLSLALVVTAA